MIRGKKVVVVLPAYNAAKTLARVVSEISRDTVDEIILTDDDSYDDTVLLAKQLGLKTFVHKKNKGYGANQKTCYLEALKMDADIVVMLHPDYQYDPRLITAMSSMIAEGVYDAVIGSRLLGGNVRKKAGMPLYRFISNRIFTFLENGLAGTKLSEYHSGYRAFSRRVLEVVPFLNNSDDFLFDNQMLLQLFYYEFSVGEVSCPAAYAQDSSSISILRSIPYGAGVLVAALQYCLAKRGVVTTPVFPKNHWF
jgi:glycosyltransferase involved in cell wall biosynthesis